MGLAAEQGSGAPSARTLTPAPPAVPPRRRAPARRQRRWRAPRRPSWRGRGPSCVGTGSGWGGPAAPKTPHGPAPFSRSQPSSRDFRGSGSARAAQSPGKGIRLIGPYWACAAALSMRRDAPSTRCPHLRWGADGSRRVEIQRRGEGHEGQKPAENGAEPSPGLGSGRSRCRSPALAFLERGGGEGSCYVPAKEQLRPSFDDTLEQGRPFRPGAGGRSGVWDVPPPGESPGLGQALMLRRDLTPRMRPPLSPPLGRGVACGQPCDPSRLLPGSARAEPPAAGSGAGTAGPVALRARSPAEPEIEPGRLCLSLHLPGA